MKERLIKNPITTIAGIMFLLFVFYLIFAKYELTYIMFSAVMGVGLLFAKDKLINKLLK